MDQKYKVQYLPEGDLQMWTAGGTFSDKDDAIRAAENLVSSGEKHVRVVYSEVIYTTARDGMKEFKTYELFFCDLSRTADFVNGLIRLQIRVEVIPVQPGLSKVVVHIQQGDNRQYRDILNLCIEQNVVFDIHNYRGKIDYK